MGEKSDYMKTPGDTMLAVEYDSRPAVEKYAADQALWFEDYANAHVKMSELGQEDVLKSEV